MVNLLLELNPFGSLGPDKICSLILKKARAALAETYTVLFQSCLDSRFSRHCGRKLLVTQLLKKSRYQVGI